MPKRLKLLVEEQEIIRRLLPSADDRVFNPDFVYFLLANLHKYSTYCHNCHTLYGNKQHLQRHQKKEHPNEPDTDGKDAAKFLATFCNIAPQMFLDPKPNPTDRADRSTPAADPANRRPSAPMPIFSLENAPLPSALNNGPGASNTLPISLATGPCVTNTPVVTRSGSSHIESTLLHNTIRHSPPLPFFLNHHPGHLEPAVGGPQGFPSGVWPTPTGPNFVHSGYNMGPDIAPEHPFGSYLGNFVVPPSAAMPTSSFGGSFGWMPNLLGSFGNGHNGTMPGTSVGQHPYSQGMDGGHAYGGALPQYYGTPWEGASGSQPFPEGHGGGPPQGPRWNNGG